MIVIVLVVTLSCLGQSPFGAELLTPNNTEYRANVGDLIELPCAIGSIPFNSRISWWRNGQLLVNNQTHLEQTSLILQVTTNHSGSYVCHVVDEFNIVISSFSILKVLSMFRLLSFNNNAFRLRYGIFDF